MELDDINTLRYPHIVLDEQGNALAAWVMNEPARVGGGIVASLFSRRFDAVNGTGWGDLQVPAIHLEVDNNPGHDVYSYQLVIGDRGRALWMQVLIGFDVRRVYINTFR